MFLFVLIYYVTGNKNDDDNMNTNDKIGKSDDNDLSDLIHYWICYYRIYYPY